MTLLPQKIVAVLGGSYVGIRLARALSASLPPTHRVVVIETNTHFNHLFTFPRFSVLYRGGEEKAFIPYTHVFNPPHSVVHSKATGVEDDLLVLENGERVHFDFLAIATGTKLEEPWNSEGTKQRGVKMLRDYQDRVKEAEKVVVVGGGAVGVQVAFDAKQLYPQKKVVLVHSRERVMNKFDEDLHKLVTGRFEKEGIETVLGSRVIIPKEGILHGQTKSLDLENGSSVSGDLFLLCTGQTPRSSILSSSALTPSGFIKVLSTMQIEGRTNIFALGDVADSGAPKTVRAAMGQVETVEQNILSLIKGQAELTKFTPGPAGIHMTLGLTESVKFGNPLKEGDDPRCLVEADGVRDMDVSRMWANLNLPSDINHHL